VGTDDGPADRQPDPDPVGLRGVESLENALDMLRIDARRGIANRDEDAISLGLLGADRQLSRPAGRRGTGWANYTGSANLPAFIFADHMVLRCFVSSLLRSIE
jgi:hypothetical protein